MTTWLLVMTTLLSVMASPRNFVAGADVRVMCKVEPHEDNRSIEAGIGEYMRSARQLDGADSKRTFEFFFKHVPCGSDVAFCVVHQTRGRYELKQQKLTAVCPD